VGFYSKSIAHGNGSGRGNVLCNANALAITPLAQAGAYQFPTIAGLEKQSITILEVVDNQDDAAAASRSPSIFWNGAIGSSGGRRAGAAALSGRSGRAHRRAEVESPATTRPILRARLNRCSDAWQAGRPRLPWDRRSAGGRARAEQAGRSGPRTGSPVPAEVDEAKLRSLTTGSLYRLQVLGKAYGLQIADRRCSNSRWTCCRPNSAIV